MKVNINYKKNKINIERRDMWNVDYTLSLIILPVLKEYKKQSEGIIWGCFLDGDDTKLSKSQKQQREEDAQKIMNGILDKMIYAFEQISNDKGLSAEENKEVDEGLELFGKYFRNLWT